MAQLKYLLVVGEVVFGSSTCDVFFVGLVYKYFPVRSCVGAIFTISLPVTVVVVSVASGSAPNYR